MHDRSWRRVVLGLFLCGVGLFALGSRQQRQLDDRPDQLELAFSVPMQLIMAFGDRYLAANMGALRATVADVPKGQARGAAVMADVMEAVSWLNPAHEDNYYIAAAILPWEGEVESAQTILWRATEHRHNDYQPPFFHGFNAIEFLGDARGAHRSAMIAAEYATDPRDRQLLVTIAAKWLERGESPTISRAVVQHMAETTKDPALRGYLFMRVKRLDGLIALRQAAERYLFREGRAPENLEVLLQKGDIEKIPQDPLGAGYELREGVVRFKSQMEHKR